VVAVWREENGKACGGTEGVVLGVTGDEVSGEYLVLDRNTFQDSFKSNIFSLDILDLKVIPMKYVKMIEKTDMRRRPSGSHEKFTMKIEADYKSNIDFGATWKKVERRTDCEAGPIQKPDSDAEYGITIKKISTIEGASITISAKGTLQIFCKHKQLDDCIKWILEAVELLPGHKRLVLFPTKITYRINDTYKETTHPTEEVIDRIAKTDGPPLITFPIGWAHKFFVELPANPLQKLFPGCQPLEKFVIKEKNRKRDTPKFPAISEGTGSKQFIDLQFPHRSRNVTQYLGADSPIIRVTSVMESSSSKYEKYLIRTWLDMRSAPWQWFSSDLITGKMIVRDLNLDKKARIWTLDLRKHSSSADFLAILDSSGSDKSTHRK